MGSQGQLKFWAHKDILEGPFIWEVESTPVIRMYIGKKYFAISSYNHTEKIPDDTETGIRASKSLRIRIVTLRPPPVERACHTSLHFPALYNYFFNKNSDVNSQAAGFLLFILISKREHSGFN